MFTSGQDLLYIVLSLCLLWFTVFLCWLLYQAGRVLRNANRMVENIMQKLELIADAVHAMRDRMDRMTGSLGAVSGLVANLVEKLIVGGIAKRMESSGKKSRGGKRPPVL
jgi:hypothetical protein